MGLRVNVMSLQESWKGSKSEVKATLTHLYHHPDFDNGIASKHTQNFLSL